ncbi:hypothetical protein ABT160_30460 [Streptomyces sp. NPDC001941]|uniref:hypothetical protein n=1 Tax=Streptomyces sp. NPDC001941 TaxID=3154659 RepID=UPI0033174B30
MRKTIARAAVSTALAAAALIPLAGAATAAPAEKSAQPAAAHHCWVRHGHVHCVGYDDYYGPTVGVGLNLGLGLGLGIL